MAKLSAPGRSFPTSAACMPAPAPRSWKPSPRFQSDIHVIKDGTAVNARSIMGLMMLAASIGSEVEIMAEGPDQDDAMKAISPGRGKVREE